MNIVTDLNALRANSLVVEESEKDKLKEILLDYLNGDFQLRAVGIAAVQLGIPKRAFAYRTEEYADGIVKKTINVVFNPEITSYDGDIYPSVEGCMSIPGVKCVVHRYPQISVMDDDGAYILTGEDARIFQHEYDHLLGKIIIDVGIVIPKDIGRNDKCICGSGRKWKVCCGKDS